MFWSRLIWSDITFLCMHVWCLEAKILSFECQKPSRPFCTKLLLPRFSSRPGVYKECSAWKNILFVSQPAILLSSKILCGRYAGYKMFKPGGWFQGHFETSILHNGEPRYMAAGEPTNIQGGVKICALNCFLLHFWTVHRPCNIWSQSAVLQWEHLCWIYPIYCIDSNRPSSSC